MIRRRRARAAMLTAAAGLTLMLGGCHGGNRRIARQEPALDPSLGGGTVVADAANPGGSPTGSPAWVDRHPLFSRPRDVYANTPAQNKLVKGAAATVVGVPMGMYGELKQIVVGRPSSAPDSFAEAPAADPVSPSVMMGELPTSVTEGPPGSSAAMVDLDSSPAR